MTKASHPLRVRGLKLYLHPLYYLGVIVAPPTGAWIETGTLRGRRRTSPVAPPTGAWIETGAANRDW